MKICNRGAINIHGKTSWYRCSEPCCLRNSSSAVALQGPGPVRTWLMSLVSTDVSLCWHRAPMCARGQPHSISQRSVVSRVWNLFNTKGVWPFCRYKCCFGEHLGTGVRRQRDLVECRQAPAATCFIPTQVLKCTVPLPLSLRPPRRRRHQRAPHVWTCVLEQPSRSPICSVSCARLSPRGSRHSTVLASSLRGLAT